MSDLDADRETLRRLMTRIVLIVEGHTKERTRVRTGHLRRSWTTEVTPTAERGFVGTNVIYARYQKNRPLHEGVEDSRAQIQAELQAVGHEWLERMKARIEG